MNRDVSTSLNNLERTILPNFSFPVLSANRKTKNDKNLNKIINIDSIKADYSIQFNNL